MSLFYGTWKQLHDLDAVGLWESGLAAHVWAQWYDSEALCLCVFPQEMFPSYTAKVTCDFPNTSHHHYTMSIHYLILSSAQPFLMFGSHSLSSREEGAEDSGPSS